MANLTISGSTLGTPLQDLLMAEEIEPGSAPSYQTCKTIFAYHPLGAKMAESPISMAQSQKREISVPNSPETRVREAFEREWEAVNADRHIFNVMRLARIYGISSIALLVDKVGTNEVVDYTQLHNSKISFNVFDPLNTAGSLVLNQDPNAMDFQRSTTISVSGQVYHRSRTCVMLNEDPLYIEYTSSAFGYVGRSVYQRALYPLKSFIQSLITDDMVTKKAGVLIAKMEQPGSIIDRTMQLLAGKKRDLLKEAATNNVLSIGPTEGVETLNLQNLDGAYGMARKNILENIAVSADMPAKLLNSETFAEGFGEGTEDAKNVARYVDRIRIQMQPLYAWFDKIVQYRAWNPEFYKTIQTEFPEYESVPYNKAFYDWVNSFEATWPSLLTEPESELVKVDDTKLKAIIAFIQVLNPMLDPENRAAVIAWAQDNLNAMKTIFENPLMIDFDTLKDYVPPEPVQEPREPKPFAATDSQLRHLAAAE